MQGQTAKSTPSKINALQAKNRKRNCGLGYGAILSGLNSSEQEALNIYDTALFERQLT